MTSVLPSEVVSFILQQFPGDTHGRMTAHQAPALAAIVRLVDQIPQELLLISGDDLIDLVSGTEGLRHMVALFENRGNTDAPQGGPRGDPIVLIRNALKKCPDQWPSSETAELGFIADAQLRTSIRLDISAAHSAYHHAEWKASTVLAGAAMEALLLNSIEDKQREEPEAVRRIASELKEHKTVQKRDLNDWRLVDLIKFARALNLISEETEKQADLARDYRNLIHPGKLRGQRYCDRATALGALAGCEMVARDAKSRRKQGR
jgi:hypothetical protein